MDTQKLQSLIDARRKALPERERHTFTKRDLTGHDVFELMMGTYGGTHWREDSLYISEDLVQALELQKVFDATLNDFSYFGITVVTKSEWEKAKQAAMQDFPWSCEVIKEIDDWAKVCFATEGCFTICGI